MRCRKDPDQDPSPETPEVEQHPAPEVPPYLSCRILRGKARGSPLRVNYYPDDEIFVVGHEELERVEAECLTRILTHYLCLARTRQGMP